MVLVELCAIDKLPELIATAGCGSGSFEVSGIPSGGMLW